jgi:hypothetical protein
MREKRRQAFFVEIEIATVIVNPQKVWRYIISTAILGRSEGREEMNNWLDFVIGRCYSSFDITPT